MDDRKMGTKGIIFLSSIFLSEIPNLGSERPRSFGLIGFALRGRILAHHGGARNAERTDRSRPEHSAALARLT
jgi:hypothetical protein